MWEYHHPLWQRPLCAAFLTSEMIKYLEFISLKLYTKFTSYISRMLSQLHSLHWANFTAQRNCFYAGRSDNTSWLFIQLHLTTTLLLTRQTDTESAGNRLKIAQKVSSGFVTPRLWPMGWRFFHLSFKLLITHHWILKGIVLSPIYTSTHLMLCCQAFFIIKDLAHHL